MPFNGLLDLNDEMGKIDLNDPEILMDLLNRMFSNYLFSDAIYISSPELFHHFESILAKKEIVSTEKLRALLLSFYKYYSRMSHRATPYGLFAGVHGGSVCDGSSAINIREKKLKPYLQMNIQTVTEFIRKLNALDPSIIGTLRYEVNNTLYTMKDRLFYVEKLDQNGYQASNLTSVGLNEHIIKILDRAKDGATVLELAETIQLEGATDEQKIGFVGSLISSQVLISELWPSVSSDDFMKDFLRNSEDLGFENEHLILFKRVQNLFNTISDAREVSVFKHFLLEPSMEGIKEFKNFFKLDLFIEPEANHLNKNIFENISNISQELSILSKAETTGNLATFIQNFHAKFEEREVPLVQAIDPNFGVGYALAVNGIAEFTPLVEGIPSTGEESNSFSRNSSLSEIRSKAIREFYKSGSTTVCVDSDIKDWISFEKSRWNRSGETSISSYTFGSIYAPSFEAIDQGDYKIQVTQINAPYAGRLLSRFQHGDLSIRTLLKDIIAKEQEVNPNVVLAEVVYIPDGKYANISLAAQLRPYEITYSSSSTLDKEYQINVNDLTVSIRSGRVVLRSIRLNKEIVPCLTNTYDARFANPIYQFLSEVSYQNVNHGFEWDWGIENYTQPFLPRIEYKNFILIRARWFVKRTKLEYHNDAKMQLFFERLRVDLNLPRYFVLPEGDNEFLVDSENPICRQVLAKQINRDGVVLFESLKNDEHLFIRDGKNVYTNEIIIPFGTNLPMYRDHSNYSERVSTSDSVRRIFGPGSEWLYLKIYSGTKNLEYILTEIIKSYSEELLSSKTIDKWFFLRYDENGYHLRIRFHKDQNSDDRWYRILEEIQLKIDKHFPEEHAVKVMIDTYQRELERYGSATIEASETIFYADSVAVSTLLSMLHGDLGEELRWKFALVSVDRLLNDFGYSLEEKKQLLSNLSGNFFNEFSLAGQDSAKYLSKKLRDRYREKTNEIRAMLLSELFDQELEEGYACFELRSRMIDGNLPNDQSASKIERDNRMASFIHMAMNRIFVVNQRKHELVIYYYLHDFYRSEIAKLKSKRHEYAT